MKVTEMIIMLADILDKHGDIQVVIQGTTLPDGFSRTGLSNLSDVFESTVESFTIEKENTKIGKRVRLHWQD